MKISIIGAGNVGSLTALRVAQDNLGEVVLVDVVKGMACAKAFDMEDARQILKIDYSISGSDDMQAITGSDVVVMTAGLARKPGMTREELLSKNAQILKSVCEKVVEFANKSIVVIVTNPLDIMTSYAMQVTQFPAQRVIGMGLGLDASRFANIISKEINIPASEIDACVIGSHGEGMLPLGRFSTAKNLPLEKFLDKESIAQCAAKTVNRGAEIVSLLGSGSAYFAPSAAAAAIVKAIVKDEKRIIGVCACVNGAYGLENKCVGVPCRIGRNGIEKIVELELSESEKKALQESAEKIFNLTKQLPL